MKTPRDILFARHQAAAPKLDAIRHNIVAGLNHQDTKVPSGMANLVSWCLAGFKKIWQELFFPSRRIWSGLATVWVFIFLINFSQREHTTAYSTGHVSSSSPMLSLQAQQRWMNELLADRSLPPEAERPRTVSPKPQTQKTETAAV